MFPARDKSRLWLYLVGGNDGSIKVGVTSNPTSRARTHRITLGVRFEWAHVFAGTPGRMANSCESDLKNRFSILGRRVRRTETFFGISKPLAIAEARLVISSVRVKYDEYAAETAERLREAEAWKAFQAQYMAASITASLPCQSA